MKTTYKVIAGNEVVMTGIKTERQAEQIKKAIDEGNRMAGHKEQVSVVQE